MPNVRPADEWSPENLDRIYKPFVNIAELNKLTQNEVTKRFVDLTKTLVDRNEHLLSCAKELSSKLGPAESDRAFLQAKMETLEKELRQRDELVLKMAGLIPEEFDADCEPEIRSISDATRKSESRGTLSPGELIGDLHIKVKARDREIKKLIKKATKCKCRISDDYPTSDSDSGSAALGTTPAAAKTNSDQPVRSKRKVMTMDNNTSQTASRVCEKTAEAMQLLSSLVVELYIALSSNGGKETHGCIKQFMQWYTNLYQILTYTKVVPAPAPEIVGDTDGFPKWLPDWLNKADGEKALPYPSHLETVMKRLGNEDNGVDEATQTAFRTGQGNSVVVEQGLVDIEQLWGSVFAQTQQNEATKDKDVEKLWAQLCRGPWATEMQE